MKPENYLNVIEKLNTELYVDGRILTDRIAVWLEGKNYGISKNENRRIY